MMWFSTLAYVALAAAATLQPITSSNIEKSTRSSESINEKSFLTTNVEFNLGKGWGAAKSLFDNPLKITDAIHDTRKFWDKIIELSPNFKEYTDEFFHHAVESYPSEKLTEFRESMVNVSATATVLRKVCGGAAGDNGVSLHSVIEAQKDNFVVLFEEFMKTFPPPGEAASHDNRTIMINAALDRFEEGFLRVTTKLGVSEEPLESHTSSLKFVVQHVAITIGDLAEQHPEITNALLLIVIAELSPLLLPEIGTLFGGWLLRPLLHMFGFGPLGPIKGGIAAWLQRWIYGATIPKGAWFAALQRLGMIGKML